MEGIESLHEEDKLQRAIRLAALKSDAARGETRLVSSAVESMVSARKLHLPPRSHDERRLGQGLQRAEIEALKRAAERDVGEFGGAPTDIVVRPPTATAPVVAALGESIMELFEVFASENPHGVRAQILALIRQIQKEDAIAVVLITHDIGAVSVLADRVIVLYAGQIAEEGSAIDVLTNSVHPYTRGLLSSVPDFRSDVATGTREIPGLPPNQAKVEPGCRFAERCALVRPTCRTRRPPLILVGGSTVLHRAACPVVIEAEGLVRQ